MSTVARIATRLPPPESGADLETMLRQNPVLTKAGSRFTDETWDLSFEMQAVRKPACDKRLDFRMSPRGRYRVKYVFPDGRGLADYPCFHAHAKRLLAVMILSPRNKLGPVYQPKTLISTLHGLKRIYCYLAGQRLLLFRRRLGGPIRIVCTANRLLHVILPGNVAYDPYLPRSRSRLPFRSLASGDENAASPGQRSQALPEPDRTDPGRCLRRLLSVCLAYVDEHAGLILDARDVLGRWRQQRHRMKSCNIYPAPACRTAHAQLWGKIARLQQRGPESVAAV